MEYAYATLILTETDEELSEPNITGVLEAAGVDVEASRVKALVAALEDVDVGDVLPVTDIADLDTDGSPSAVEDAPEPMTSNREAGSVEGGGAVADIDAAVSDVDADGGE